MPSRFEKQGFQTLLAFCVVLLVLVLTLGPDGLVWRTPVGALAGLLVLEVWRRSRRRGPPRSGPESKPAPPRAQSLLSTGLYDPLTRLPNRTLFNELLEKQVAQALRSGHVLGVMVCDVDRFKSFNDSLGEAAADHLLRHLANRFQRQIRQSDTLARTGGDAFTLIIAKVERPADVALAAKRVLDTLRDPFVVGESEVVVSVSAGISVFPHDATEPAALLRQAEEALSKTKAEGGNGMQLFAPSMNTRTRQRAILEQELRRAIDERALAVHYQPQFSLVDGTLRGCEALVRWPHAEHGLLNAGRFIPLAEEGGLMNAIGGWLMEEICRQNASWVAAGLPPSPIALNVSIRQFQRGDVVGLVRDSLASSGLDPALLQLEITETIAMLESERIGEVLGDLRDLGVEIHLDDFGTGFSSLSYLLRYPVDVVKIDRSFVAGVTDSEHSAKIVRLTISLAESLGLGVVAEGIETPAQLEMLRAAGCPTGQGFLLGRPMPASDFEKVLASGGIALADLAASAPGSA